MNALYVYPVMAAISSCLLGMTGFGSAVLFLFFYQLACLTGLLTDRPDKTADALEVGVNHWLTTQDSTNITSIEEVVKISTVMSMATLPVLACAGRIWKEIPTAGPLLVYFIPSTALGTPIGNVIGEILSEHTITLIAGILVLLILAGDVLRDITKRRKRAVNERERSDVSNPVSGLNGDTSKSPLQSLSSLSSSFDISIYPERQKDANGKEVPDPDNFPIDNSDVNGTGKSDEDLDNEAPSVNEYVDQIQNFDEYETVDANDENELNRSLLRSQQPNSSCMNSQENAILMKQSWWKSEAFRPQIVISGIFCGLLSGIMGGLTTMRAPPTVLFFIVYNQFSVGTVRATGTTMGLTNVPLRMFWYIYNNEFSRSKEGIIMYISVATTGILGLTCGMALHNIVPQEVFGKLMKAVLLACGCSLLFRAFTLQL